MPGTVSLLQAIETASGVSPIKVEKPEPFLLNCALETLGTEKQSNITIGYQMSTDVASAQAAGPVTAKTPIRQFQWQR
ncbi:HAD hydrolase-like protein [Ruegeria sp. HKCCA5426]|uniref:HAD hydrolase-like protein n=1 Tax=Ruegeria sp. HKCCA5426 TaxID=2682985 RepID=UPI001487C96B